MRAWKIRMVVAVALPVSTVVFLGSVQAQYRPPSPFTPPKLPSFNPNPPKMPSINPPGINQGSNPFNPPGVNQGNNPFNPGMNQGNNPFNPNPKGQPGKNLNLNPSDRNPLDKMKIWTCSGCGGSLGIGEFPAAQCPFCRAKITNSNPNGNGNGFAPQTLPIPQPNNRVIHNPPPVVTTSSGSGSGKAGYIVGVIAGLGMVIGGVITSLKCGGIF